MNSENRTNHIDTENNMKIFGTESKRPIVSVICAVKNCENHIEKLVNNVRSQTCLLVELLIIDGASKDRTSNILKKLNHMIDYQVSEPDTGIYDAMDKGIEKARGRWIYFMGADDTFFSPSTLSSIFDKIKFLPQRVLLVFGNVADDRGKIFRSRFDKRLWFKNTLHHQGAFYHRNVFEKFRYKKFGKRFCNPGFQVSGDYYLNLKLLFENARYHNIDEIIARCGKGVSKQGKWVGYKEEIIIRHRFMSRFFATPFDILTLLRFVFKRFLQFLPDT